MLSVGEYWFSWVLMPFLIISCTMFIFVVSHLCLHFCTGQQNSCVCRQITAFHLQPLPIIALMSSVTWLQRIESNWMESFLALNPVVFFLGEITHSGLVVSASDCSVRTQVQTTPPPVVFIATAAAISSLGCGLHTATAVPRSTQAFHPAWDGKMSIILRTVQ